jgi:hypothetical protein
VVIRALHDGFVDDPSQWMIRAIHNGSVDDLSHPRTIKRFSLDDVAYNHPVRVSQQSKPAKNNMFVWLVAGADLF